MKATGLVSRIDTLGRVVIPREIRKRMRIHEGDPLEIFLDSEGIVLKKYSPVNELSQLATEYAKCASATLDCMVLISDADYIIAESGGQRRTFIGKKISKSLEKIIHDEDNKVISEKGTLYAVIANDENIKDFKSQILVPIVSQGDAIGSIVILSKDRSLGNMELKVAEIGASFLARQMEI